jgi:hypothetical protein
MINCKRLVYVLLCKNIIYYGYVKGMSKKTKILFFISKYYALKKFIKLISAWKEYCFKEKTFLQPIKLFDNFYTLSYPTIEYKIVFDLEIEAYYFSLWVNKRVLYHTLIGQNKIDKKIKEIEYHAKQNNINFQPFYVKYSSESSELF